MRSYLLAIQQVLDRELFRISGTPVTLSTVVGVFVFIVATFWISRALRKAAERVLVWKGEQTAVVGTVTALFAAGAIVAVGLGFAMQSIAQNFVAGIILLSERAIKPGDVLEVEGKLVRVVRMGIRSSVARSRDGEDLIIPNATLIQTTVKNFTLRDSSYRIRARVGVVYGSDMRVVSDYDRSVDATAPLTVNQR
jgi:small-conductance mechanosensitive channel